ncbi:hypothetical protein D3C72_2389300 [compost metagenome]
MTHHVGNTALNPVGLAVHAAGDRIAFARMGEAIHHDACIGVLYLASARGLVTQADKMPFSH